MKFIEIIDLMFKNNCLMELIQGYCVASADQIEEMNNLIPALEIMLSNHKKLWNNIDIIEDDVFKNEHPEFFQ